jgi:cytoskeletal protein CcmA (bactofilin family)
MFSKKPEQRSAQGATKPMASSGSTFSVIGTDVVIKGDVSASADLHVDGKIEGDIACASLVQGEGSVIEGAIRAQTARLAGTVKGTIAAKELFVLKTARVEGDVEYDALTVEQGAAIEGRFAPTAKRPAAASTAPVQSQVQPQALSQANKDDGDEPRLTLAR